MKNYIVLTYTHTCFPKVYGPFSKKAAEDFVYHQHLFGDESIPFKVLKLTYLNGWEK